MRYQANTLDNKLAVEGYNFLGVHTNYRVYACGFDRKAYVKKIDRGGIGYELTKVYKSEEYIEPKELSLCDLVSSILKEASE